MPTSETLDLAALDDAMFEALYQERLEPCFRGHEEARVKAAARFKQRMWIGAPAIALAALVVGLLSKEPGFFIFVAFGGGFALWWYAYAPLGRVGAQLKQDYCTDLAQAIDARFTGGGFAAPALSVFKQWRLLPGYDRSSFEDLFEGAYRDAGFALYEAHLEKKHTDSKGRTSYSTCFRGQLIRLAFPRKFLGVTIVRRDAGIFNFAGGGNNLERVRLEDPVFEKAFEVWGNDQVEARYLLHPVLMQRLLDLETSFKGKKLRCGFVGGDLLVAIEGGNLFEPGDLFKTLLDKARARRVVDELAQVVRVLEQVLTAQAKRG